MNTDTIIFLRGKLLRIFLMLILLGVTQSFAQVDWTKYEGNPVLTPGSPGEWDDSGFAGHCVIFDGTTYKIWYGASDGTTFRIGYATSPDGINWTKYNDPSTTGHPYADSDPVLNPGPGVWENFWVYFPYIYFDGSIYHMWYAGTNGYTDRVGYATSPDGIVWTKLNNDNPVISMGPAGSWDDSNVDPGPVQYNGTNYEMLYNGSDGLHYQAGYAASADGINWTKYNDPSTPDPPFAYSDPVLTFGCAECWDYPRAQSGSVVYNPHTSKYYLFYSGGELFHWKIGYATADSFSGHWIKNPSIILDTIATGWESLTTAFPYVIFDSANAVYKMWYLGGSINPGSGGSIGYATAWVLDTLYVPNDYQTIQEAIDAANNGAVVLVEEGTYMENINFKGKAITVASKFIVDGDESHIQNTIIDGSQPTDSDSASVVSFKSGEDTTSVLCGFTITGGTGTLKYFYANDRSGGGIFAFNSGAKIINNIIDQNAINHSSDAFGGGICLFSDGSHNYIIENNVISNNNIISTHSAYYSLGGGIYTRTQGYCRINNNKILNNSVTAPVGYGGAIEPAGAENDHYWIVNNYISGNNVNTNLGGTGGIDIYHHAPIVENNVIVNNTAPHAGAIFIDFTTEVHTSGYARGFQSDPDNRTNSIPKLLNNTIANNTATFSGGGIVIAAVEPEIINCIIWGNAAPADPQISGTANVQYSDIEGGYAGTGNGDWDPLFRDTTNNDFHLMSTTDCGDSYNSNCIDAGDPAYEDFMLDCAWGLGGMRSDMGAYSIPKLIVGISEKDEIFPNEYELCQNYPNPFNPATVISWQTPVSGWQTLKVYDILGREVTTLINEYKPAGRYEISFNAVNLPSGVYFYQLKAGEFIQTKKMILLK